MRYLRGGLWASVRLRDDDNVVCGLAYAHSFLWGFEPIRWCVDVFGVDEVERGSVVLKRKVERGWGVKGDLVCIVVGGNEGEVDLVICGVGEVCFGIWDGWCSD